MTLPKVLLRMAVSLIALAAGSLTAQGQSPKPVVGFINNGAAQSFVTLAEEFRRGLNEAGFAEGRDVNIEFRWAEGDNSRLPALVRSLVQSHAAVIAATGGAATTLAARVVAAKIPVVFVMGADPIKFGLVASLNRPGGNITGVSFLANALLAKQVEILHEAVGRDAVLGFLVNPENPNATSDTADVTSAATMLGHKLIVSNASTDREIDVAFASLVQKKIQALLIFPDAFFTSHREKLLALLSRHKLPALYNSRDFAVAGGLIGYGAKQSEAYRNAGIYAGRILKGEKPSELPVMQSTNVELTVNLKTAKALGLDIPQSILARADEIIE